MKICVLLASVLAGIIGSAGLANAADAGASPVDINRIGNIVVIYAENRSFDNLYGSFPGAHGLSGLTPAQYRQLDRDGTVLSELPPIWDGLTAKGVVPPVTQAQTEH
ncbi:MAG TPA: alkaline phosphatase family protein, partial [Stellaceae bacterium]|nr:alkaline phosphatase family protein [Stellaceae bacterium]